MNAEDFIVVVRARNRYSSKDEFSRFLLGPDSVRCDRCGLVRRLKAEREAVLSLEETSYRLSEELAHKPMNILVEMKYHTRALATMQPCVAPK